MIEVSQPTASESEAVNEVSEFSEVSAGTLMRRAREAAGLHVAALAVSLKVPVRKLEALEADRIDLLGDAVFVRGLASSVCRTLKIDPRPVLERLPQSPAPRLVQNTDGLNTPFRAPGDAAGSGWLDPVRKPVFLAVFLLLMGALVLILMPSARQDRQPAATSALAATPVESALTAPAPPRPVNAEPPSPAAAAAPAAAAVAAAAQPAVVPGTGPSWSPSAAAAAPAPPASAATASASAAAPAATGLVVIRARGESWVDVTDAKGLVVVRRTLAAGESAGASGALPLQVTVGRVDVTDVLVRNKPFDMRSVSRDNVARFEVK